MKTTELSIAGTVADLRESVARIRREKPRVGLVATMGALHGGHLGLVEHCQQQCDATVVSIFVNPAQFSPDEDLADYPRPVEKDLQLLADAGVDLVFLPEVSEVYPRGCSTAVKPPNIARILEGASRPTHFQGVATVVLKLLNMTGADVAFFGQKDLQQALVIQHMVQELNHPADIVICPIVRDDDGLALSSRNVYLSDEDRVVALSLNRTLNEAVELIRQGENDGRAIMAHMTQGLIESGVTETDYAVIVDARTLETQEVVSFPVALLVAAKIGTTRLIDNKVIDGPLD